MGLIFFSFKGLAGKCQHVQTSALQMLLDFDLFHSYLPKASCVDFLCLYSHANIND